MNRDDYLVTALEAALGPAMVLDEGLRIVAFTPGVVALLGQEPELGIAAPKLLCGHGEERPVAEALAAGRSVHASILRPLETGGNRLVQVRANPLETETTRSWLLLFEADQGENAVGETLSEFGIMTRNVRMKELLRDVRKVAKSEASVLVRGETGSGKELVARAIHDASPRRDGPFRAINCAALPPNLLESELFGHVRGAFTGAVRDNPGHFRMAEGGSIFLDEVAEIPLDLQSKLLRVLQDKTVIPVGGGETIAVDVRIISATHRALRQEVEAGRFRADLLYRLRVIPLYLPPLRERTDDIEVLAWHFVKQQSVKQQNIKQTIDTRTIRQIAPASLERLQDYEWPGNVRELQNVIEYATVMGEGPVLQETDLPPELRGEENHEPRITSPDAYLTKLREDLPAEARRLLNALERAGGHMGRAAGSLGISRTTLWRRLRRYGLDRETLDGASAEPTE